jgi:hypothetical protein
MSNMPNFPGLPNKNSGESDSRAASNSPSAKGVDDSKSSAPEVELEVPKHQESDKPKLINAGEMASSVKAPSAAKKGILVVAIEKGFYNQQRKAIGDKFNIKSEEEFGSWFKCVDKEDEKRRVEHLKAKKAKK